jgi:hypothetical protein
LLLFDDASGAGPVRVLLGLRPPPSPDVAADPPPDELEPPDDPPPRVTAVPLPPPLGPDERGVAFCPSSDALYASPLLKPSRCRGANSRVDRSPKLMDGDDAAPVDGELNDEPPPPLLTPPLEPTVLPPPPLPRSTAPPLLGAPPPLARSTAPDAGPPPPPVSGFCAKAGAAASATPATTIPRPYLRDFMCAPIADSATDLPRMGP